MSPVRSKSQWRYFGKFKKNLLRKWQKEAPRQYKSLPTKVKKRTKKK